jgi:hypothetical protein
MKTIFVEVLKYGRFNVTFEGKTLLAGSTDKDYSFGLAYAAGYRRAIEDLTGEHARSKVVLKRD